MSYKITDSVSWVGKIDWELRSFHGEELSTHKGSSYNSYLVRDEKNVLIDSVYVPFGEEWVEQLRKEIDLDKIDYIVANHGEPDHSGGFAVLMELIPNTPIYCTANGAKSLKGYYGKDWNFQIVKTGDKLPIGKKELVFVEAAMLHWPDSMATFLTGDNILFSNDMFGQHFASEHLFDEFVSHDELVYEAMKYYANIVQPFSPKVIKKIGEIAAMKLPIEMICPSHGLIWRSRPNEIIELYSKWANAYSENQITIIYDTMYNSTRRMAESIAEGIRGAAPEVTVKLFNTSRTDHSDLLTEIFRSKAVIAGSPTVNGGIISQLSAILEDTKNLGLQGKLGGAFCSYGWSPAGVKVIAQKLTDAGFAMVGDGVKAQWKPTEAALAECRNFGAQLATHSAEENQAPVNE